MFGDAFEILIGGQHGHIVAYAQLRQKRVDRRDLHAISAAMVSQLRRIDMIVAIRNDEGQGGKALDNPGTAFRPGKALKKLLQDKAGRQKRFAVPDGFNQRPDFRPLRWLIPPQGKRPDAGVDEKAQLRWRSAL